MKQWSISLRQFSRFGEGESNSQTGPRQGRPDTVVLQEWSGLLSGARGPSSIWASPSVMSKQQATLKNFTFTWDSEILTSLRSFYRPLESSQPSTWPLSYG
nr:uncharacterized protein LOC109023394 [Gorilla gorilla gorilla]